MDYYTRAEFIRKLQEAVLIKKGKPLPFPKPPRRDLMVIPLDAQIVTLEEEMEGVNAKKLLSSGI